MANSEDVDALRAEIARLREALEPFAAEAEAYDPPEGDDYYIAWGADFPIGALRRARAALHPTSEGSDGE